MGDTQPFWGDCGPTDTELIDALERAVKARGKPDGKRLWERLPELDLQYDTNGDYWYVWHDRRCGDGDCIGQGRTLRAALADMAESEENDGD